MSDETLNTEETLNAELDELVSEAAPEQSEIIHAEKIAEQQCQVNSSKAEFKGTLLMMIGPVVELICPNWNIQQAELDALCDAYADAAAHQWPEGFGEMGPWAGAVLMTAVVVGPRLKTPRKLPPPPEQESEVTAGG